MYAVLRGARVCKSFAHVHLSVLTTAPEVGDVPIVQVRKLRLRERLSTPPKVTPEETPHLWAPAQPLPTGGCSKAGVQAKIWARKEARDLLEVRGQLEA